ncbi:MAG: STAS domain-containing protein [Planctomycetota bacterium]
MAVTLIGSDERVVELALDGRLDTAGVDQVETRLYALLPQAGQDVIVHLAQVDFLTSMGIRMLVTAAKAAARRKNRLVLVGSAGAVAEALESAAIDQIIPIRASRQEALDWFEQNPRA